MKSTITTALCLAAAAFAFCFSGCASYNASNQESLLTAAGFRIRTPKTAKQQQIYASVPPYKIQHGVVNGKVFYAYKDPAKGVAYVGGEAEYQQYQKMAIAQRIASDYYMAAEMNRDAAWGWYGAWGPAGFWW
jgi:hypothetical protein